MRILVIARDRKHAEAAAFERYPVVAHEKRDSYTTRDDALVDIAIFGQDLSGRRYDRIVVAQQKYLSEAQSQYLSWRLNMGGRFEAVQD